MSKEPIPLGHSVERHEHHDSSHHNRSVSEIDEVQSRRAIRDFQTETLSTREQVILAVTSGSMFIGFVALILFLIFRH